MKYTVRNAEKALIKAGATQMIAQSTVAAADAKGYAAKERWEQINERETFTPSFNDRAEEARAAAFTAHIEQSLENYK